MADFDPSKWDHICDKYDFWRTAEYNRANYEDMFGRVPQPCRLAADVGCGSGLLAGELAAMCERVVGFDISWGMLLLARRHLRERGIVNVHLLVAEANHPPMADAGVDLVFSVNVLHHTDLDVSLPALQRLLAPGGRLAARVITTRNRGIARWRAVRFLRSLKSAPGYFLKHGLANGLKISALLFHPRWLREDDEPHPSLAEFAATAARLLPGSTVAPAWRGGATVYWERPAPG